MRAFAGKVGKQLRQQLGRKKVGAMMMAPVPVQATRRLPTALMTPQTRSGTTLGAATTILTPAAHGAATVIQPPEEAHGPIIGPGTRGPTTLGGATGGRGRRSERRTI